MCASKVVSLDLFRNLLPMQSLHAEQIHLILFYILKSHSIGKCELRSSDVESVLGEHDLRCDIFSCQVGENEMTRI